ncbi:MAG TPA: putative toxin-antitoxin system toxin component, PIN family, partial [Plasticicumulans sp.]|nr:putative toxin-antitoxin system toxin component, PIN family [Plasticicumulans sp.]
ALHSPGLLLDAARAGSLMLCTSAALLAELADILSRRKFERKLAAACRSPDQLVAGYAALATAYRPAPVPRIAPDPDDDVVIGTALAARAPLIVTGDRALLSVGEYADIKLLTVSAALVLLSSHLPG